MSSSATSFSPEFSNKVSPEMDHQASVLNGNGVPGAPNGVNGSTNGVNGHTNGHVNGANGVNGHANGINGTNGSNGNLNGVEAVAEPADTFTMNETISGSEAQSLASDEIMPIAVVGMSCRFPGGCNEPSRLWDFLKAGKDGWTESPKDRFDMKAFYHPETNSAGTINATGGHWIKEDLTKFDAPFFGLSPVEAKAMDPQQRLNLETAYEALENGGIRMEDLIGSQTSVYYGVFNGDYARIHSRDPENFPFYQATGSGVSVLANRLSYCFDLRGPSMVIDTGCSGSLVGLHLACQSIRSGESKMSIVGGTNVMLDPQVMLGMSRLKFFSEQGRCYTFDNRGTGYGRGEGVAAVILKPLSDALRDGDPIRAVIRNTGTNSDGKTPGLTLPSALAQETLIRKVYKDVGFKFDDTAYFEAHGTGTSAGDPLEAEAIGKTFGQGRSADRPIYVGSIKTNIGHTESTSGIAGFIKTVLVLENGAIPPNAYSNFKEENPEVKLNDWNIKVARSCLPWPENTPRRASLNSFGYGGSNAHAILDSRECALETLGLSSKQANGHANGHVNGHSNGYTNGLANGHTNAVNGVNDSPAVNGNGLANENGVAHSKKERLFVVSAKAPNPAKRMALHLRAYLGKKSVADEEAFLDDLAHTLGNRRSNLNTRFAVRASSVLDLISKLHGQQIKPVQNAETKPTGFVFTGQGAQWYAMGRELMQFPVFRSSIEVADKAFRSFGANWKLIAELNKSKDDSKLGTPILSQPSCTALQVALVDLLDSWGIRPASTVGHSSGEIAAAYAAGILTARDAWRVAYFRGYWVNYLQGSDKYQAGSMMAIGAKQEVVEEQLAKVSGTIGIACFNSPESYTISGDATAVDELKKNLDEAEIWCRKLQVDVAYHSKHMEAVADEYLGSLEDIKPQNATNGVLFFSSVTGGRLKGYELDNSYWVKNLTSPVKFTQGLESLISTSIEKPGASEEQKQQVGMLVEIGPHAALQGPVKQSPAISSKSAVKYFSVLKRDNDAVETAITLASSLYVNGVNLNTNAINGIKASERKALNDLPKYPWNHSVSHWQESRISKEYRQRTRPRHHLLGVPDPDYNVIEPSFRHYVRLTENPWLKGHVIQGSIIFPAAAYICAVIQACIQHNERLHAKSPISGFNFRDLTIGKALLLQEENQDGVETKLTMRPEVTSARGSSETWNEFRYFSHSPAAGWTEHCRGLIEIQYDTGKTVEDKNNVDQVFADATKECRTDVIANQMYSELAEVGLQYSGPFQSITGAKQGGGRALVKVSIPDTKKIMPKEHELPQLLHPATLDCCFQSLFPALMAGGELGSVMVPTAIASLYVSNSVSRTPGDELTILSGGKPFGSSGYESHITVLSDAVKGRPSIKVSGLVCSKLDQGPAVIADRKISHNMRYLEDPIHLTKEQIDAEALKGVEFLPAGERIDLVEVVVSSYVHDALEELGDIDIESIPHEHNRHQYKWMKEYAAKMPRHRMTDELHEKVLGVGSTGQFVARMGKALPGVIRGEIDPLSKMLEEDLLYRVYNDESQDACYAQMSTYLKMFAKKNPGIKILEIGAGTGGATKTLLETLGTGADCQFAQYDFTDISTGFFEKAMTKLADWGSRIKYKKCDIEKPVDVQGFQPGTYDMIIAVNVLHATTSINNTLNNARALLKPGGQMLLMEILRLSSYLNITFGCLSGWWLGVPEGRTESPLLDSTAWDKHLKDTHFSGVDTVFHDNDIPDHQRMGAILTTAVTEDKSKDLGAVQLIVPEFAVSSPPETVSALQKSLEEQGRTSQLVTLETVEPKDKFCIFLSDLYGGSFQTLTEEQFGLAKALMSTSAGLIWLTRGASYDVKDPTTATIVGWLRVFHQEYPDVAVTTIDLDPNSDAKGDAANILKVFRTMNNQGTYDKDHEAEFVVRDDKLLVPRLMEQDDLNSQLRTGQSLTEAKDTDFHDPKRPMRLLVGTPGLLDSLVWQDEKYHTEELPADEIVVEAKAYGVNFRDVMVSLGQLSGSNQMGAEVAGIVTQIGSDMKNKFKIGDRVCGWSLGCYSTYPRMKGIGAEVLPDSMSLEAASSIPIVFCTAWYALITLANLQKDETVLIHSAMGGVGQAAIQLAQNIGAEIYVTVGTAEKRKCIKEQFGIDDDHIFSSRGLSFKEDIYRATKGAGVNVVLNSLAGEGLRASLECISYFGRFIEIGKKDILTNFKLEMQSFDRNISFHSVDLTKICEYNMPLVEKMQGRVFEFFRDQKLKPLYPITTYPMNDIEGAFRLLQAGKHMGKVVMTADNVQVKALPPRPKPVKFRSDATYMISGGLGGLGQSMCEWLGSLGAKNVVVLSRSGLNESHAAWAQHLKESGINLTALKCDVTSKDAVNEAFATCKKSLPPIRGIFQAAMVLKDVMIENMTYEDLQRVFGPKLAGTKNLHDASLDLEIDFFVNLSSGAGTIGNQGQANYGATCAYQDAFARYRHSLGLKACTLDLGVIQSAGYVAQNQQVEEMLARRGLVKVKLREYFTTLGYACNLDVPSPDFTQIALGLEAPKDKSGFGPTATVFQHLNKLLLVDDAEGGSDTDVDIAAALKSASNWDEAVDIVLEELMTKVAKMLAMQKSDINPTDTIVGLGADSLVAVELRNWLVKSFEANVQVLEILNPAPLTQFAQHVAKVSSIITFEPK